VARPPRRCGVFWWEGIGGFTLGAVVNVCLGITGTGPTVGLTLSTTSVSDTGGGDVPIVTMKDDAQALAGCQRRAEHRHDDDVQRQRACRDDHGVQERGVAESRNNSCENPRGGRSARSESG
jgi:hypothetical protein